MPTLEDLLKGEQGGEYTDVVGYLKDSNYTDSQIIDITDRQIGEIKDQTSTFGEERSQLLTFQADRKPDGYDLTKATIKIGYQLADGTGGESAPINVMANSDYIQFSWLIPAAATQKAGKLLIMVYAVANGYTYKTLAKQYEIKETLEIGGTIPEPDINWYTDFIRQMDAKITQAASSATNAANSAAEAEKSKSGAAAILAETKQAKDNAIAAITDKCSSYAEIDKIKNVTLSGKAEGSYISVDDAASWRLSNLTVQGKSEQAALTGKNLFNKNTVEAGKYINNNTGELVSNSVCSASEYINVSSFTNIYITAETTGTRWGAFYDASKNYVAGIAGYGAVQVPASAKYLRITVTSAAIDLAQVESGTVATAYEPYTGGKPAPSPDYPQPIKSVENPAVTVCGKNLLNVNEFDGSISPIGKFEMREFTHRGTYTMSADIEIGEDDTATNTKMTLVARYTDGTETNIISCSTQKGKHHYAKTGSTNPAKKIDYFFGFVFDRSTATGARNARATNVQIEFNDTETDFEPYTGHTATLQDVTLRSLPDGTSDRIEKRAGVWGIDRYTGQYTADGSGDEAWSEAIMHTTWYAADLYIRDGEQFVMRDRIMCSGFQTQNTGWGDYQDDAMMVNVTSKPGRIYFHTKDNKNLVAFKNWLASNPITIQYALATPTWEPLSDALQAELNKLESHAGQTNIFTDSSLQPNMTLEYIQDPNKVIDGLKTEIENIKSQLQPQA